MVKLIPQIPIEHVFYGKFVTYAVLDRIVKQEFSNSRADKINIYIDLFQFLSPPHQLVRINDFFIGCAAVINYCGHLRQFFRSRYRVESNIILIASSGLYKKSRSYIEGYNKYYNDKIFHAGESYKHMIHKNLELLEILCPYLPDIYFRKGSVDASVMIKYLIDNGKFPKDCPNLVISNSQFMYQLPSIEDSVVVIRQRREYKDDISFSYNSTNCLNVYMVDVKKHTEERLMNSKFTSFFMIMNGLPKLNVKSAVQLPTAIDIIDNTFPGAEHDCNALYDSYRKYYMMNPKKKVTLGFEEFKARFMAVDIVYQYLLYKTMSESKLGNFYERQLIDPREVKNINQEFFKTNPMILDNL